MLAACGNAASAVTATVDQTDITVAEVEALIDTEDSVIDKTTFAQYLGYAIQFVILDAAAEQDFGVSFTDQEIASQAEQMVGGLVADGQSREDFLAERGITETFLSEVANQSLIDAALRERFLEDIGTANEEELTAARNAAQAELTTACVSHILVPTQEDALLTLARLQGGEDFGAVATQVSQDAGSAANQGALGCGSPAPYAAPFRDAVLVAEVGEIHPEVVETQFGYHIILVTERQDAAEEDVTESTNDNLAAAEFQSWFFESIEAAEVIVVEEYGVWQANPPTVIPPTTTQE